jgi:hypothetical protein
MARALPGNADVRTVLKSSSVFMPALGADGSDRVALTFFRTMDDRHVRLSLEANIGPRSATSTWNQIALGDMMTPNPDASANAAGLFGDVTCVIGDTPPSSESCSQSGPFEPFWPSIVRLQSVPTVQTDQVSLR